MSRPPTPASATGDSSATGDPSASQRLDVYLVTRGLARSRGQASELITSGAVTVDGRVVTRASHRVASDAEVAARAERWVGRAAYKLLAALELFGDDLPDLSAARCLDIGASTGGFTQVLLERGVRSVVALDVGHGQLAPLVAADPRVVERSGLNVRDLAPGDLGEPFDVVVGDLSFISLRLVLPVIREQLARHGVAILLVKPQFEVGRGRLGKGGVVRSERDRTAAVRQVLLRADELGLSPCRLATSPLPGTGGNVEYLVLLRRTRDDRESSTSAHASCPSDEGQPGHGSPGGAALVDRLIGELDRPHHHEGFT